MLSYPRDNPNYTQVNIVGVHNANKEAIAWETPLSFAAYQLYAWVTGIQNALEEGLALTQEQDWLLALWKQGVAEHGWSLTLQRCWQQRYRPEFDLQASQATKQHKIKDWNQAQYQAIQQFNQLIERAYSNLSLYRSPTFPATALTQGDDLAQQHRQAERNYRSAKDYLDTIKAKHGRLLVIRLDLFYQQGSRANKTLADLQADKQSFFKNRRQTDVFNGLLGHVWCFELGEKKSIHCHLLLIFNGNFRLASSDYYLAQQLGERWVAVTQGQGDYFNSNTRESKESLRDWQKNNKGYQERLAANYSPDQAKALYELTLTQQDKAENTLAIGKVDRDNQVSWANLVMLLRYFTKLEQGIPRHLKQTEQQQTIRCFGKGKI